MIPTGTPEQQVLPKHARTQYNALTERRDYPDHVCPGQHCLGRQQRVSRHRHTDYVVHTLTPAQAARATDFEGARAYYRKGGKR